jgi:hypothetical protein
MSRIQPLTKAKDEIEAMALNILGLKFMLLLGPLDPAKFPLLHTHGIGRGGSSCRILRRPIGSR